MPRILTLLLCTCMFAANAQTGYQIRIKAENIHADSLFVKSYDVKNKKFINFLSLKFENDITIKDKTPLDAGIYIIHADSTILSEFLISDAKNQKFTISILEDDIKVEGSKENDANRAYMKKMVEFAQQQKILNAEFQQLQESDMPNSMVQTIMDSFFIKFDSINVTKRVYQEKVIADNKGTLLASVIQSSMEPPSPPQELYRDKAKLFSYLSENHFISFPWNDERLLHTPLLYNKFRSFAQLILPLQSEVSIPIVIKELQESKRNKNLYYAFFDYFEHEFGSVKSPYRNELLYVAMLQDILQTPDLEEARKLRYEYELKLITKNQPGDQAIDFNILLNDGDTTTLYDIEAETLIIYFQNPDCPTCGEFRQRLKNMEVLYNAVTSGKLKIITIYFEKNEELWRNYLQTGAYKTWMHGWNYDLQISEEHLYDVRFIPTIMVLDKDKKVIKKDIFPNELEVWLKQKFE